MFEKKSEARNVFIALGIACIVLSAALATTTVAHLKMLGEKGAVIEDLNGQISELRDDLNESADVIVTLEARVKQLNNQIKTLQSQKESLQAQISQLQNEKTGLIEQIQLLEYEIAVLEASYSDHVKAYLSLVDKVNHRCNHMDIESFITPTDRLVQDTVFNITGGWSDDSNWDEYWDDIKELYLRVCNNIEYRYDGLYPLLPNEPQDALTFRKEMWQFPNETLLLKSGDCEDQAILLCSMIRCYNGMRYKAEAICIESNKSGHVAVQILVSGGKLVIFDPAGHYYSRNFFGNIMFNSIEKEINNWLNYWKPGMGNDVRVCRVFSDYMDRTFSSTNEYISWMQSRQ
ncbi:MAG: transglutaminase-like domain-containing protein [Methanomassiliicoccales archaeon]